MSADRELLELAAKASGYVLSPDGHYWDIPAEGNPLRYYSIPVSKWNPLTDDGDALRLAVKLGMYLNIDLGKGCVDAITNAGSAQPREWLDFDGVQQTLDQATRRVIVRAAAADGKAMQ